ncbi:hypothetical protein VTN49DRAFT_1669 [Thermomyces lanuginosus]|uniref:uncharacterized protein n=1 Tax=Thermomyces lanuginosus TaxID=5541 RepID=UPI003741EF7F
MPSARAITQLPVRTSRFSSTPVSSAPCRAFSQTAAPQLKGIPQSISVKSPAEPSMRTRFRDLRASTVPQDLGLLPGTFIRPVWHEMPSIFKQPRERLRMEWLWWKTRLQNFLSVIMYSKYYNKSLPLRLKERRTIARDLHREMYTRFASGDVEGLKKICCPGLATSLVSRINKRAPNEIVTWSLDKYLRRPSTIFLGCHVVSDRATQIPEVPDSGIRQVVVRITSRQTTTTTQQVKGGRRGSKEETFNPPQVKTQDCTEYIVVQKMMWMGEEREWRIWGHAKPTTVEDLENPFFAPGLTLSERLEMFKDSMQGGGKI